MKDLDEIAVAVADATSAFDEARNYINIGLIHLRHAERALARVQKREPKSEDPLHLKRCNVALAPAPTSGG